jgi:NADH:ubiquinone oxidoreductase subunit 3 (subunit A)
MATTTSAQPEAKAKSSRIAFYIVLAVAIAVLLIVARIMGMPKGTGIEHEPQESGNPARPSPQ